MFPEKSSDFDLVFQGPDNIADTVTMETNELTQFSLCLWVRILSPGAGAKILVLKDTDR